MYYIIGYSGLNESLCYEVVNCVNDNDAGKTAWEAACNDHEGYVGLHGVRSLHDIIEEDLDGNDDEESLEEAEEIFNEEREGWISYSYVKYENYDGDYSEVHHRSYKDELKELYGKI